MRSCLILVAAFVLAMLPARAAEPPAQTATGIPLDAPWKVTIYQLARAKFVQFVEVIT